MSAFRQTDISRAVAGAIKGGLHPGTFQIEITKSGSIRILPAVAAATNDDADLDEELRRWKNGQGS